MGSVFFLFGTEVVKSCFSADGDFIPADGVGDPPMMIPEAEPVRPEESLLCRCSFRFEIFVGDIAWLCYVLFKV